MEKKKEEEYAVEIHSLGTTIAASTMGSST
jgi:hypothetical protein